MSEVKPKHEAIFVVYAVKDCWGWAKVIGRAAMATELDEKGPKLTIRVPFEKNMKKSKFVIVEFLNQYKVRYNQTNLIILKILSVILKSKNIKILLFFIWILNQ